MRSRTVRKAPLGILADIRHLIPSFSVKHLAALIATSALLGAAIAGPVAADVLPGHCRGTWTSVSELSSTRVRLITLCALNAERRQAGLAPLHLRTSLTRPAQEHSRAMVADHDLSHGDLGRRVAGYTHGHTYAVGEDIGTLGLRRPTVRQMVLRWMRSPEHRGNILQPQFRDVGIGVVRRSVSGRRGATFTASFGWRR